MIEGFRDTHFGHYTSIAFFYSYIHVVANALKIISNPFLCELMDEDSEAQGCGKSILKWCIFY